jgi:hypothetical protein
MNLKYDLSFLNYLIDSYYMYINIIYTIFSLLVNNYIERGKNYNIIYL